MAKKDYSHYEKEELIEKIRQLEDSKKYGLVWEDKPEKVVKQCQTELPVLEEIKDKEITTDKDKPTNILIEGDNYHALSVLNYTHAGKIDVIYIDPPYNTGSKDFIYNDNFVEKEDTYRHSKWLAFMDKRLKLAKNLLSDQGMIAVSIDDNEMPRLTMLIEKIFDEKNVKTICVKMSESTGVKMASVVKNGRIPKLKEYLIVAKKGGIKNLFLEKLPKEKWDDEYKTIITNATEDQVNAVREIRDNEDRTKEDIKKCNEIIKDWKYISLSKYFEDNSIIQKQQESFKYNNAWRIVQVVTLTGGAKDMAVKEKGSFKKIPSFFGIVTPQRKMYLIKGEFNHESDLPRCKLLFADDYLTVHLGDFWFDIKTTGLDNEGGVDFKNGKKPLKLIERIINMKRNTSITVLDFFAGSGTTGEATLELNRADNGQRKFILCTYNRENGSDIKIIDSYCYPRLKNVIKGYNSKKALGGNLKYFKTNFVPKTAISDDTKYELVNRSTEMICLREDTFDKVLDKKYIKIFEKKDQYTAILFHLEDFEDFKKELQKLDKPIHIYVFSLTNDTYEDDFKDIKQKFDLCPIPESILEVYRKIFKE